MRSGLEFQRRQREFHDALRVNRDPCRHCAVPHDRHPEHGCNTYVRAVFT